MLVLIIIIIFLVSAGFLFLSSLSKKWQMERTDERTVMRHKFVMKFKCGIFSVLFSSGDLHFLLWMTCDWQKVQRRCRIRIFYFIFIFIFFLKNLNYHQDIHTVALTKLCYVSCLLWWICRHTQFSTPSCYFLSLQMKERCYFFSI